MLALKVILFKNIFGQCIMLQMATQEGVRSVTQSSDVTHHLYCFYGPCNNGCNLS